MEFSIVTKTHHVPSMSTKKALEFILGHEISSQKIFLTFSAKCTAMARDDVKITWVEFENM